MNPKKYLFLILLFISIVGLSITGLYSRTGIYKEFFKNYLTTPASAVVFKAAAAGVFPWSNPVSEEKPQKPKPVTTTKPYEKITIKPFIKVEDDYFDDALFIGDSRMAGLAKYCEALDERATFFAKKSLTIYDIRDESWIPIDPTKPNSKTETLWEALEGNHFTKIYIMVGINEIGIGDENVFREAYEEVLSRLHSAQPGAIIYITSIMHVTAEKSEKDKLYNNPNIDVRNDAIKTLADSVDNFYLNLNEAIDDEDGGLNAEWTGDGVHLKGSCYEPWHEYLLSHGVKIK